MDDQMEDNLAPTTDPNPNTDSESMAANVTGVEGLRPITLKNVIIGSILIVIVLITILGNLMVLVAVYQEKRLRTTFNYYLVNLAITDLGVAVTAMSFYSISYILGYWPFGEVMCGVWIFFDYGMTFVSVFTLLLISIDRYWSVKWYVHYRTHHTNKTCLLSIAFAWMFMLILWLPPCIKDRMQNTVPGECKWEPSLNPIFVIIVAVVGHHGSCCVLLFCYVQVFIYMRQRRKVGMFGANKRTPVPSPSFNPVSTISKAENPIGSQQPVPSTSKHTEENGDSITDLKQYNTQSEQKDSRVPGRRRDLKVFVTLSYILVGYIICWVPFHFVFDISCIEEAFVPENVFIVTFWMTYLNSTINPILYNFSNLEFRNAFRKMLRRRRGIAPL